MFKLCNSQDVMAIKTARARDEYIFSSDLSLNSKLLHKNEHKNNNNSLKLYEMAKPFSKKNF